MYDYLFITVRPYIPQKPLQMVLEVLFISSSIVKKTCYGAQHQI